MDANLRVFASPVAELDRHAFVERVSCYRRYAKVIKRRQAAMELATFGNGTRHMPLVVDRLGQPIGHFCQRCLGQGNAD